MPNSIERREHTRIKVRWPIAVVTDDSTIEGETRDITTVACSSTVRSHLS